MILASGNGREPCMRKEAIGEKSRNKMLREIRGEGNETVSYDTGKLETIGTNSNDTV